MVGLVIVTSSVFPSGNVTVTVLAALRAYLPFVITTFKFKVSLFFLQLIVNLGFKGYYTIVRCITWMLPTILSHLLPWAASPCPRVSGLYPVRWWCLYCHRHPPSSQVPEAVAVYYVALGIPDEIPALVNRERPVGYDEETVPLYGKVKG